MNFSSSVLRTVLAGVFLLFAAAPARAESTATTIAVPHVETAPALQGAIDDSWSQAARLTLGYDFTYRHDAGEPTAVYVVQDRSGLDLAFVVTQKSALTELAVTNGSSVLNDDYVGVYFFPNGTNGFQYAFFANPRGARYQSSTENSAYAPTWSAVGKPSATGYTVTMHVPLDAIRSAGANAWKVQFVRATVATNALSVWTFAANQRAVADPVYAGTLSGIGTSAAVVKPKARAQVYALGEATPVSNGGSTSRVGADLALPVTPTASFVATLHPDYSNVEIDQQTISPTAFARQYSEVRPFFTQASQQFNGHFGCFNCPTTLYTPAIPTFSSGYALEGTQGAYSFGAFDALGNGRTDQAQTVNWALQNADRVVGFNAQRVAVDAAGGVHDDVDAFSGGYGFQRSHLYVYANEAIEDGSLITLPSQARYTEFGTGYNTAITSLGVSYQHIGSQFAPLDGFVNQSDIEGLQAFGSRTFNFSPTSNIRDVALSVFVNDMHDRFGAPAQRSDSENIAIDFRDLIGIRVFGGYSGVKTFADEFLPFESNGFQVGYRLNTSTPTSISYNGGAYYHGALDAWSYSTSRQLTSKVRLSFEVDEDNYESIYPGETRAVTWLERVGANVQLNRDASFDVGARRIFGAQIPNSLAPPVFTTFNAGNLSAAFHYLRAKNEFYFVYGNPNSLSTTPAFYVKWIRYIGAPKGT